MVFDHLDADVPDRDKLTIAIGLYALDEISLGKAAERAGLTRWEFMDVLQETGIPTRLGPQTMENARGDIEIALDVE